MYLCASHTAFLVPKANAKKEEKMETSTSVSSISHIDSPGRGFAWGYEDGLSGEPGENFTHNLRLAFLEDPAERLDYYRGHRAGWLDHSAGAARAA